MNINHLKMQYQKEVEQNGKKMKKPQEIVILESKQRRATGRIPPPDKALES